MSWYSHVVNSYLIHWDWKLPYLIFIDEKRYQSKNFTTILSVLASAKEDYELGCESSFVYGQLSARAIMSFLSEFFNLPSNGHCGHYSRHM